MDRWMSRLGFLGAVLCGAAAISTAQAHDVVVHQAGGIQWGAPAFVQAPPPVYPGNIYWGGERAVVPEREWPRDYSEHRRFHREQAEEHEHWHEEHQAELRDRDHWRDERRHRDWDDHWDRRAYSQPDQGYQRLQRGWDNINQRAYYYYGPDR